MSDQDKELNHRDFLAAATWAIGTSSARALQFQLPATSSDLLFKSLTNKNGYAWVPPPKFSRERQTGWIVNRGRDRHRCTHGGWKKFHRQVEYMHTSRLSGSID